MRLLDFRSDEGLTRLESAIVISVLLVGVLVGGAALIRNFSATGGGSGSAGLPVALPAVVADPGDAPVSVSVVAPGTIAQPPAPSGKRAADSCPDLRGVQPAGFDCTLPLYVPALDLSAVRTKAPYQCADEANYRLVKGQAIQPDKKCVLKTARASRR